MALVKRELEGWHVDVPREKYRRDRSQSWESQK